MEKIKGFSRAEFIIYGVFCAAGAAILLPSLKLGLGEKGDLGPGFLPFVAGLCVLVSGALLAILNLMKRGKASPSADLGKIDRIGLLRSGGILVNFAVWPLLVGIIGYLLSTFLISLGLAKAVGYKDWRWPILLSVMITVGIWVIFGVLFHLDLPSGFSF
ncbi:MAG: tripartite tricarboxylate transporter TctB family protein [Deltaproteobacteria bacterium]|nr:tripartite tricarboxylate transporter TctB family protein [Deltaproteobacteria bacterium]